MNSELIDKVYESCFAQQLEELDELFFLQVRPVEYDIDGSHRGACLKRQVRRRTLSQVSVAPSAGVSSTQFDQNVMSSYNSLPDDLVSYFFLGTPRQGVGRPNSNNAASSILLGAGVSGNQIAAYGATLYSANNRWAPGLGTSATGGSSQQGLINQIAATVRTISGLVSALAANKKSQ